MRKIVVIVCSVFLCLFAANISWSASWLIEEDTHHLGGFYMPYWDVPDPEGYVWEKDFSLPAIPSEIEYIVLGIETFDLYNFSCSPNKFPKIYINDILIGTMLGHNPSSDWVPYTLIVQSHVFQEGTNSIRIDFVSRCGSSIESYDYRNDFMFRDVKLMVNNWQENSRHGN